MCDRIVVLIDMDCFYCQVETRLNPSLKGKPLAVVQYNKWKGGGIIAVNYEARKFGVTRHLRGDEAKQKCQDIVLVHVPSVREKADLTKYRDAGREVVNVLCQFSDCVERASVDEAYIDITNTVEQRLKDGAEVTPSLLLHTFVVGLSEADNNDEESRSQSVKSWLAEIEELQDSVQLRLAVGAALVEEMRTAVYSHTGFECSAGIAHNKILSKLACGLHKPNRQTVLPQGGVNILYQTLPIKKIRSLGGKFGDVVVDQLGCAVMADLAKFSEKQLQQKFDEKTGTWLYNIARGIDNERVTQRLVSKSIGCCKKFPGKQALGLKTDVEKWLFELATEVSERLFKDLQENKRRASLLTVSYSQDIEGRPVSSSRSGVLSSYEPQKIVEEALELLKKSNTTPATANWNPPLKYLGISVGKFSSVVQAPKIDTFFKNVMKKSDNERPLLKCNVTAVARSDTFGDCGEITHDQEGYLYNNSEKHITVSKSNGSNVSSGSKNHCSLIVNSCTPGVSNYKEKQTLIRMGTKNVHPEHQLSTAEHKSSTVSNSKAKILASMSNKSKSRSFFINYLRTKNHRSTDSKQSNSSCIKVNDDRNCIVKPSTLHHVTASCSTKDVEATDFDEIGSPQVPSDHEHESDHCVSISEIFPNISQADSDVVELLPTQMRNQIKKMKLAKQKENQPSTSKVSQNSSCSRSVAADSIDSSLPDNEEKMNNVSVVVDVHRNLSPEDSYSPSSSDSIKAENDNGNRNSCLLSSLQDDDTNSSNKNLNMKRFSGSEIPFKNVDRSKIYLHSKPQCSRVVTGIGDNCMVNEDNVNDNDAFSPSCVGKSLVSEDVCVSNVENISVPNDATSSSSSTTKEELCPECRKMVPLKELFEHLDFHVAEKLQKELNSEQQQRPVVCRSPLKQVSGTKKRGRPAKKQGSVGNTDKKMRSITTFFTPR